MKKSEKLKKKKYKTLLRKIKLMNKRRNIKLIAYPIWITKMYPVVKIDDDIDVLFSYSN
jgi:hypothetical protein